MTIDNSHRPNLAALRSQVRGAIAFPGDAGWETVRTICHLFDDQHPVAVVVVEAVEDVVAAVRCARANGLQVAVQDTPPGDAFRPTLENTIVLSLTRLRRVEIDGRPRRLRVEAGANWAAVARLAAAHGFAVDDLSAVEVVTADGRLVWADRETETDLFRAIRDGGDGFGVVTAMEFRLLAAAAPISASTTAELARVKAVYDPSDVFIRASS